MTKVPVNVPNFAANMMYGSGTRVQSTEATGEFGKIFENQKNATSEVKSREAETPEEALEPQEDVVKETDRQDVTEETGETKDTGSVKEASDTQKEQNTGDNPTGDEFSEDELNLVLPMLQVAAGDLKEALAKELGITTEELDVLLENMGLDHMDLLNQGTMKEILLQTKGLDMTAVLTNEELYGQIQELEGAFEEVLSNVQDTLQVSEEELNTLKEQLTNTVKEPVVMVQEGVSVTDRESTDTTDNQNLQNAFEAPNQSFMNQLQGVEQPAAQNTVQTSVASPETEQIMNQIMDYMKLQLTEESQTLEMQLQPESLGTLQIRISAKEGIMTAQFTTASESVKAALEGQLLQLQQQFENQNIKVDAIEVTVQTHQFESALQQGDERQQQTEDGKKSRVRKIDLSQVSSLEETEEISEEDRIVAEMMAANGNTVDYLA